MAPICTQSSKKTSSTDMGDVLSRSPSTIWMGVREEQRSPAKELPYHNGLAEHVSSPIAGIWKTVYV